MPPACRSAQQGREPRPFTRRTLRPGGVRWHPKALALRPDQPEIAAGRTMRVVAFVQQRERGAQAAQAEGDRRTDQSAADHCHVEAAHVHGVTSSGPPRFTATS
jgi:hypothetical protein